MNCPACSALLSADKERCPACGAVVAPRTEGALAPDLGKPPASRRPERLQDSTFRKREPAWKDEVRERLRHRKKQPAAPGAELPLFPDASEQIADAPLARPERYLRSDPAGVRSAVSPERRPALEPAPYFERVPLTREAERPAAVETIGIEPQVGEAVLQRDVHREPLGSPEDALAGRSTAGLATLESQPEMADLPLHPELAAPEPAVEEPLAAPTGPRFLEADERESDDPVPRWSSDEIEEPLAPATPVERPALLVERMQAAALDVLAVGLAAAFVVYFAARTARVPVLGLAPTWPYLAGFLGFFGLVYASFFTGLTGQTLGKMMFRLRVVDRAGAPPGHGRAALRALLGTAFSLALIGIAPIFLDPARRALHDRLLKTRVIHI